ncbi:hypothetical protein HHL28_00285 [Aerophototrophica crusticola]|uniref:Uncharacterized protein n=1 Tax=Aerophototrophica crusticola TaxID=1709002 RepID=A0A858R2Z9_9PROT|nr:hypothetical protein HHL28_00285 [Rhodospirillaceae bacterium B3]
MAADSSKPGAEGQSPFADALRSNPKDNAEEAERLMGGDAAKRRETEQAQANKKDATEGGAGSQILGKSEQTLPPD